jgi:hypothetical protein
MVSRLESGVLQIRFGTNTYRRDGPAHAAHLWKYKWRRLTVDVSDFDKNAKPHQGEGPSAEPAPDSEQSASRIASEQSPRYNCGSTQRHC